jgi:putative ABC transport system substrate-binding protein
VFIRHGQNGPPVVMGAGRKTALARRHALQPLLGCLAATACAWWPSPARARPEGSHAVAVLYPDIGEPFRAAFLKIIEGIEERVGGPVARLAVGTNAAAAQVVDDLRRREIRVVVALGRNGLKVADNLGAGIGVVAGCVLSVPESQVRAFPVHSLAPDPALLFERLQGLAPSVRRVWVVYDPRQNAWLIKLAREAARSRGLELAAQEAIDLAAALRLYQQALSAADARRDAVWLPQDSTTVDEGNVLPLLLKEAWDRSLVVFSSNVAHVKRGALFALFPDNAELGRRLGAAALQYLGAGKHGAEGMLPLREVLGAVNSRTAGHLGLALGPALAASYPLVYPEP